MTLLKPCLAPYMGLLSSPGSIVFFHDRKYAPCCPSGYGIVRLKKKIEVLMLSLLVLDENFQDVIGIGTLLILVEINCVIIDKGKDSAVPILVCLEENMPVTKRSHNL